ncbi:hypothetical protein BKA58DRAFT_65933 [Alternaria rosae]|uniref:uncharacterized protein n=1 Tax=Alternaria rosae TaxID=1187941 RepID=UPI001E8D4957|nr:uncharacterized protein BKA58DRAFT_65933 [Alternaria rosae]KAH6853007.1 hypothetical protein BKA58DRAFT_65933 [Alternaria rosae]
MFQRWWALSAQGNFSTLSGACGASFHACFPFVGLQKTNTMTGGRYRVGVVDGWMDGWMMAWTSSSGCSDVGKSRLHCSFRNALVSQSHHRKPSGQAKGAWAREAKGSQLGRKPKTRPMAHKSRNEAPQSGARARRKWRIHGMFHLLISHLLPLPPSHHHRIHLFTVHRALS